MIGHCWLFINQKYEVKNADDRKLSMLALWIICNFFIPIVEKQ